MKDKFITLDGWLKSLSAANDLIGATLRVRAILDLLAELDLTYDITDVLMEDFRGKISNELSKAIFDDMEDLHTALGSFTDSDYTFFANLLSNDASFKIIEGLIAGALDADEKQKEIEVENVKILEGFETLAINLRTAADRDFIAIRSKYFKLVNTIQDHELFNQAQLVGADNYKWLVLVHSQLTAFKLLRFPTDKRTKDLMKDVVKLISDITTTITILRIDFNKHLNNEVKIFETDYLGYHVTADDTTSVSLTVKKKFKMVSNRYYFFELDEYFRRFIDNCVLEVLIPDTKAYFAGNILVLYVTKNIELCESSRLVNIICKLPHKLRVSDEE